MYVLCEYLDAVIVDRTRDASARSPAEPWVTAPLASVAKDGSSESPSRPSTPSSSSPFAPAATGAGPLWELQPMAATKEKHEAMHRIFTGFMGPRKTTAIPTSTARRRGSETGRSSA